MSSHLSLWSKKEGHIRQFLDYFYEKNSCVSGDTNHYIINLDNPTDAADIIACAIDNSNRFSLQLYIQLEDGDLYKIDENNYNDVIKGLYEILYFERVLTQNQIKCNEIYS